MALHVRRSLSSLPPSYRCRVICLHRHRGLETSIIVLETRWKRSGINSTSFMLVTAFLNDGFDNISIVDGPISSGLRDNSFKYLSKAEDRRCQLQISSRGSSIYTRFSIIWRLTYTSPFMPPSRTDHQEVVAGYGRLRP
jgi:hypothetical protein